MFPTRLSWLLAVTALLTADAAARDLKTVGGEVFRNIIVAKKDATGLQIAHDEGVIFLDFRNLGEAERKEFGYEPAAYVAAWQARIEAEKIRRQQQALAVQQAVARARAQAAQPAATPLPRAYAPAQQPGLEVTIESPGMRYGPYSIDGRGFSNTIPPSQGGSLVPYLYYPYDGRNGAYWGPTQIRRR